MVDGMQHGLLTRNALYLAVMDPNHIQNIVSFDTDIDRIEHITNSGI
jgi:predicted nucleic acid-binding protein